VPGIYERHRGTVDGVLSVPSEEAVETMRWLAREHGMFVGPSSGAHLVAPHRIMDGHPELKTVVTSLYISGHFRDAGPDANGGKG
jgi:cysteine synthase A